MKQIDLRSDTVTKPSAAMMEAMMKAKVGDDVYGEDPTINKLEAIAAKMLGKEKAIFCTSGTQSNLLALLVHCERGDEYIVGQLAHTYRYEGGGAAVFGSIQPQPLDFETDGTLSLEKVSQFIKPDDFHFAKTALLCLENTQGGKVLPQEYLKKAKKFTKDNSLSLHLDGARIFNAAVKLNIDVKEITQYFDTISCCLSKGLGAPVGSVLCGPQHLIKKARRWRKVLGGGMRQAGILAGAGIYALSNNIQRLEKDHGNALALARGLAEIEGINIDVDLVQTNIFFADIKADMVHLCDYLKKKGIIIDKSNNLRIVTHLDISEEDIDYTIKAVKGFFT
ncbi:MAG: low-specificity L-threonine aldolase [Desulfobacula sp.]|jgi:threonine aldolase|uniref:low-specificity L-threonine aldolase n=1 Tax=Desulfobacula sp. TaxID=2593537 RepID=UPI001DD15573|nr:low-specificity L-threonine aldolase [Desulfobacula sp.]MBT3486331.1 low-specificity L-threonine aldolase [Desulfobacula sp.]MBT3805888.1 low-specificity L-threonine aldolase [Desulfobacula sp.]MBT4026314.1 low-specificity L-threonine aldolase [Desulfobacula sp.]MBT4198068.1 low-specificity L-threonine aldolase [Desulfobacula sp.]